MLTVLALSVVMGQLVDDSFDSGTGDWATNPDTALYSTTDVDGRRVARITVPPEAPKEFYQYSKRFDAKPGDRFEATAMAKGVNARDGKGVYMAMSFFDKSGDRITFVQSDSAFNDFWTELLLEGIAPKETVSVSFSLIMYGYGEALFDRVTLKRTKAPSVPPLGDRVTIQVTNNVVCPSLIGFGAEDNGWYYAPENRSHGVTEADLKEREDRIRWMDMDWVRMFFWIKDWCPEADWQNYTFDSPNMQSHYKTLDLYQETGARVTICGTEWSFARPFADPPNMARAIGDLLEHLIRERGYTCIKDWTLTNEPNLTFDFFGGDFERFVLLHQLVAKEFERRGLDVNVFGSDDGEGFSWFSRCVKDKRYESVADLFGSHWYVPYQGDALAQGFFERRLNLLQQYASGKPFVIAEYGFQDPGFIPPLTNPHMKEYEYALRNTRFCIDGLNAGVAGFQVWCLDEYYGPTDQLMTFGLWDHKYNDFRVRPVYHSVAMFSRQTDAGDTARQCKSSYPKAVKAAWAGNTLFWVNLADKPVTVCVDGVSLERGRTYTQDTLQGDRECGTPIHITDGTFTAAPLSFGFFQ